MSGDDTFLSRWSKRKREALMQPSDDAARTVVESETKALATTDEGEDQPFDLSLLPDLESLTGESDIQSFLHKAVPDALRNAALRKVWALDPSVRNYVGEALDYAYDWNTPGGIPGFGEILSDEQSVDFVRNLLAGPDANENVIEHAEQDSAAQQSADTPSLALQQADEGPDAASRQDNQASVDTDFIERNEESSAQLAAAAQPQRKARHGGALPG